MRKQPVRPYESRFFFEHYHFPEPSKHARTDERDESDSPWIIEASVLKSFPQFTRDYVRDGISYANLHLLQASIPPFRGLEDKGKKGGSGQTEKVDIGKLKHANEVFELF